MIKNLLIIALLCGALLAGNAQGSSRDSLNKTAKALAAKAKNTPKATLVSGYKRGTSSGVKISTNKSGLKTSAKAGRVPAGLSKKAVIRGKKPIAIKARPVMIEKKPSATAGKKDPKATSKTAAKAPSKPISKS